MSTHSGPFEVERVRSLFNEPVSLAAVCVNDLDVHELEPLSDEELYGRTMATKRLREFRAGRHCAKRALAALGVATKSLPRDEDGVPRYPAGIVASITHTGRDQTLAIAAAARGFLGLGLDAEAVRTLEPEVIAQIATPKELRLLEGVLPATTAALALFSAKESFYKCAYPRMRLFLGFHEVRVEAAETQNEVLRLELHSTKSKEAGGPHRLSVAVLALENYVLSGTLWQNG